MTWPPATGHLMTRHPAQDEDLMAPPSKYPEEFRRQAAALVLDSGPPIRDVAVNGPVGAVASLIAAVAGPLPAVSG